MTPRALEAYQRAVNDRISSAADLLCSLIRVPSVSGSEEAAVRLLADALQHGSLDPALRPIPEAIRDHPEYSFREANLTYAGRHNLAVHRKGRGGGGRSLILQTHLDVVPADDWPGAFEPEIRDGIVWGRGACDCKGQAVLAWLVLMALEDAGVALRGDLQAQFVVEEEIGGNGALAMILGGSRADGVVVLEATGGDVHPANRGAIWFRIVLQGQAVHMGRKHEGVDAISMAAGVVQSLEKYERSLIERSRGQELFAHYTHPVQVNVGIISGGKWPSMVAESCTLEGGVGFLPNTSMETIKRELAALLAEHPDPRVRERHTLDFPKLHNDAYALDPGHPLPVALAAAAREAGLPGRILGWNVSCDARLYAHLGGMPTVVFGPGDVVNAHSAHEQISLEEMRQAALALGEFVMEWCGVNEDETGGLG